MSVFTFGLRMGWDAGLMDIAEATLVLACLSLSAYATWMYCAARNNRPSVLPNRT